MKKAWLKFLQFLSGDLSEEQKMLIKILAVGVWADKMVHKDEVKKVKDILATINDKNIKNIEIIEQHVSERIETYTVQNWLFQQEREEVIKKILRERNWDYAEYLLLIFKADNIITDEEDEIIKNLNHLIEAKKFFKTKFNLEF